MSARDGAEVGAAAEIANDNLGSVVPIHAADNAGTAVARDRGFRAARAVALATLS